MDDHQLPPPDLRGRARPDRMFRILGALITGYESLSIGAYLRPRPTQRVDRDLKLVVDGIRVDGRNVRSYRLVAAGGEKLPSWQPGCHLDVLLPTGRRRQYSLCGDPRDRSSYRIAVRRIDTGAGGSRELHDSVGTGSALTVRGPRNGFPYVRADRYLFIAGGIGITPIMPMVKQAAADGAQWQLVYTGRSRASMPFLDELGELDPARVRLRPYDEYGFPASGSELLQYAPDQATVYCCEPAAELPGDQPADQHHQAGSHRRSEPQPDQRVPEELARGAGQQRCQRRLVDVAERQLPAGPQEVQLWSPGRRNGSSPSAAPPRRSRGRRDAIASPRRGRRTRRPP